MLLTHNTLQKLAKNNKNNKNNNKNKNKNKNNNNNLGKKNSKKAFFRINIQIRSLNEVHF